MSELLFETFDVRLDGDDCAWSCAAFKTGNERERIERGCSSCSACSKWSVAAQSIVCTLLTVCDCQTASAYKWARKKGVASIASQSCLLTTCRYGHTWNCWSTKSLFIESAGLG